MADFNMMSIRPIDAAILAEVKRQETTSRPQTVPLTIRPEALNVKLGDFDHETQESIKKLLEWMRVDPSGLDTGPVQRDVSDKEIYEAISQADITALDDDKLEEQIDIFSYVVQSGRMESFSILGRNGDQTTTSIYEYLTWLTTRREEMKDDGTYSPKLMRPE